jgi:hypothetical protein
MHRGLYQTLVNLSVFTLGDSLSKSTLLLPETTTSSHSTESHMENQTTQPLQNQSFSYGMAAWCAPKSGYVVQTNPNVSHSYSLNKDMTSG